MVTDIISPMIYFAYEIIKAEKKILNIIYYYIEYLIILICSLIYNEVIICNICVLNKYTTKFINQRQKEELDSLKESEDDNSSVNNNNN